MKAHIFDEQSLHAKIYKLFYKRVLPDTICKYIQNYAKMILLFPALLMYRLMGFFDDDYITGNKERSILSKVITGLFVYVLLLIPFHIGASTLTTKLHLLEPNSIPAIWFILLSIVVGLFEFALMFLAGTLIIGLIGGGVYLFDLIRHKYIAYKYKKSSINSTTGKLKMFYDNFMQKYCTKIEWINSKKEE